MCFGLETMIVCVILKIRMITKEQRVIIFGTVRELVGTQDVGNDSV